MKLIIAGSRVIKDYELLEKSIEEFNIKFVSEVISGCAKGVDTLGEIWAAKNKVPVSYCPAKWTIYGNVAGHIRNREMAQKADMALVLWDGKSKGSENMIQEMCNIGKPVCIKLVEVI